MSAAEYYEKTKLDVETARKAYETAVGIHLEAKKQLQAELTGCVIPLSFREMEVVELARQGLSNKAMADRLNITERTVKFHMTNLLKKHGTHSRTLL